VSLSDAVKFEPCRLTRSTVQSLAVLDRYRGLLTTDEAAARLRVSRKQGVQADLREPASGFRVAAERAGALRIDEMDLETSIRQETTTSGES
jgi:hypothetical protein